MTSPSYPVTPAGEPVRSCSTCPSFVPANETAQVFRRETNIAMCGRFGYPLGMPSIKGPALTELWESTASKCPAYSVPRPVTPESLNTHLTMAAPEVLMAGFPDDFEKNQVTSCMQCKWHIGEHDVRSKYGITGMSLCGGTGRLLAGNSLSREARQCELRRAGVPELDIDTLLPQPQFKRLANIYVNGGEDYQDTGTEFIEPREYPTDKEVGPNSLAAGIAAWRKVVNPRNETKFVYLPIYADSAFSDEERALIPRTGDDEHPELYRDHGGIIFRVAMAWVGLDETPALWGPAGTGKTELFRHMAWLMNLPFRRITITDSTEVDDLIGKAQFSKDKGTYFIYGRLPQAWSRPGVICADEPNVGQPEVWQCFRPLTDNSKQLVIDQNANEIIPRHDDCYFGMAMNPAWDPRNIGANQLADADGSRLGHIRVELPPPAIERQIVKKRCELDGFGITNAQLTMIEKIAKSVRQLSDDGAIPISWGVRNQLKVARALQYLDPVEAYRFAVVDSLEPEVGELVLTEVNAIAEK